MSKRVDPFPNIGHIVVCEDRLCADEPAFAIIDIRHGGTEDGTGRTDILSVHWDNGHLVRCVGRGCGSHGTGGTPVLPVCHVVNGRDARCPSQPPHEEADGELALHVVERVGGNDEALLEHTVKRPSKRLEVRRLKMLELRELSKDTARDLVMDAHEELREQLAPRNANLVEITVVRGVDDRYIRLVLART